MDKILIATDGSAPATEALELGLDLAADEGATAIVVYVLPLVDSAIVSGFGAASGAVVHEIADDERAVLTEAVGLAETRGVDVEAGFLRGAAVGAIVTHAEARDVDLIVVGSRGHGVLTSALLGSVSRGVLRQTSKPVLIVRASGATVSATPELAVTA